MTAPLSGESWGLSEPREPHLLPAVLGLEAQRVRACVRVCMHACACPSMHCLQASTGVHTWVCTRAGTSRRHIAAHLPVTECLLCTQLCILCKTALGPASRMTF